jgi:hypothetical protein
VNLSNIKLTPLIDSLRLEDISDEIYFSTKFSNYISNSRLSLINPEQDGSPEKFFNGTFNNFSDSLIRGSALHQIVLQPEDYFICGTVNRPTGKSGYIADFTYKSTGQVPTDRELIEAAIKYDYYGGNLNDKKILDLRSKCNNYWRNRALFEYSYKDSPNPIYLDSKGRFIIESCYNALNKNKKIQDLLYPKGVLQDPVVGNEKTILMDIKVDIEDKSFILKLKSKLDNYCIDLDNEAVIVNDLKTISKILSEFDNAILKYHYYREMAMYCYLLSLCATKFYNIKTPTIKSNFLVVSTIPDFYTKVVPMNRKLFNKGFNEFKTLVKLVAYYVANDSRYNYFASL